MKSQDESSKLAAEAVSNLHTTTAFSAQTRILKMLKDSHKVPMRESIRQALYAGLGLEFSQSIMGCTWPLGFWYGGKLINSGHLSERVFANFYDLVHIDMLDTTYKLPHTPQMDLWFESPVTEFSATKHFREHYCILRPRLLRPWVIAQAGTMTNDLSKGSHAVKSVFAELDRETLINPEHPNGNKLVIITVHVEIHDVITFIAQNTSRYNDACGLIDNEAPRDSPFSTLYNRSFPVDMWSCGGVALLL
ncbi:ABC transporter B family member 15-like protein [Tanacetum coccineum]